MPTVNRLIQFDRNKWNNGLSYSLVDTFIAHNLLTPYSGCFVRPHPDEGKILLRLQVEGSRRTPKFPLQGDI